MLAEMHVGMAGISIILACVWSTTIPFLFETALETAPTVAHGVCSDVECPSWIQCPHT